MAKPLLLDTIKLIAYRKIPKNKPQGLYFSKAIFEGLIFGVTYIWTGLCTEGNLGFKINWAGLWLEGNLPFCFVLRCI